MSRLQWLKTATMTLSVIIGLSTQAEPVDSLPSSTDNPAILFVSPKAGDVSHAWVDWDWLQELHEAGFEIDVTNEAGLDALTWERIHHFNVIFLYASPDALLRQWRGRPSDPEKVVAFQSILKRFAEAGGGIFMMPTETNIRKQVLADATRMMDAKLPAEAIIETNPLNLGLMTNSPRPIPLAWTAAVPESPVSTGVQGIWYPPAEVYMASQTNPLVLGPDWTVVLRSSPTSHTVPVQQLREPDNAAYGYDINETEDLFYRENGEKQPAIFAIREWHGGRVALCPMWRMFSVANGTQWIYNREVLSKGIRNRPSDLGKLLQNTFRWLAAPSLETADGELGGYTTPKGHLAPPNQRPGAFEEFVKKFPVGTFDNKPPADAPVHRGLIGAQTDLTSGTGTVADYADAARETGLDYVVFLEDITGLTPESWQAFSEECATHSTDDLLLIPGYSGRNNIGNFMFMFGPDMPLPPANCLREREDGRQVFYIQRENTNGELTQGNTPLFSWLLDIAKRRQIGYGDFASSPTGMQMDQLRLCGMVAVDFYRDGKLVERLTEDYLRTAQGTIPPTPAAVNIVTSPADLTREVSAGRGLTYAQAAALDTLFPQALRYTSQYDGVNTFPSSGPIIEAWPACARAMTFGAEAFVPEANLMHAPLQIHADAGLQEVAIYDGRKLYRRFLPGGAKTFAVNLVLDRVIQKNLVLTATDTNDGRALSFPRRSWKTGSNSPVFCSDHINDMITISMARGPFTPPFLRSPMLPESIGGWTWDGGPKAVKPFGEAFDTFPRLTSDQGTESAKNMLQTPLLVAADELSLRVASERRGAMYGADGRTVYNPWRTFGPQGGKPAELFTCTLRYAEWMRPMLNVKPDGWAFGGERNGIVPAIWTAEINYLKPQTIKQLRLATVTAHFQTVPEPAFVVFGSDPATSIDLTNLETVREHNLPTGEWMAIYSSRMINTQILFNRGTDLLIELRPANPGKKTGPAIEFLADNQNQPVETGETHSFELGVVNFPVDVEIRGPADVLAYVNYLTDYPGLELRRGTRIESPGVLEVEVDDGVVDLALPNNSAPPMATAPLLVTGLNPRWSTGVFQRQGYVKGYYGNGENRWRPLALDPDGRALVPMFTTLAPETDLMVGHPVVADAAGNDLFIQTTRIGSQPAAWHVSVNNPTDTTVKTTLRQALPVPGLDFEAQTIELAPGEYRVLREE